MGMKRTVFLLQLFLVLILTGNLTTAQNAASAKSGGCGGGPSKTKVAANSSSNPNFGELDSRRWSLTEIGGTRVESSNAFIEFNSAEKRFTGNAGCNQMFGKFETNGGEMNFSGIGTTRMFCSEEGVMKLESDFTKALEKATRFEINGEVLNVFAGNDLILKFSGITKDPSGNTSSNNVTLEDRKWVLISVGDKAVSKIETSPFLIFNKQKLSVGGDTGCNSFGGSYKTEDNKISFIEIISTMRACIEDERMEIERGFLGGLQTANRFEIKNGKLNLYQGERLLVIFEGRDKN